MTKQTKKNKDKWQIPAIGKKAADEKINSLSLEDIIKYSKGLDYTDKSLKEGKGHWNPELRKQLGSLYHGNPYHFFGKTGDYIEDHFNHLYGSTNKRLTEMVEPIIDDLIDNLNEEQLISYLYGLPPSKTIQKTLPKLAKAHSEYLKLLTAAQDPKQLKAYLTQYYKDDGLIQSQLGDDKLLESIYESTLQAEQQKLLSYFTKVENKDGKPKPKLIKDFLKYYVKECIKGSDKKIRPQIYKNLAYEVYEGKKQNDLKTIS
jgi:hypothetical protein